MKTRLIISMLIFTSVLIQGCATGQVQKNLSQQLDAKLVQEKAIKSQKDLRGESSKLLEDAPGLTPSEKAELKTLRESTATNLEDLRLKSLKLRSVLIKELMAENYNPDEVILIEKRIQNIEQERLSTLLKAIGTANEIMGRWASRSSREDFIYSEQLLQMNEESFH